MSSSLANAVVKALTRDPSQKRLREEILSTDEGRELAAAAAAEDLANRQAIATQLETARAERAAALRPLIESCALAVDREHVLRAALAMERNPRTRIDLQRDLAHAQLDVDEARAAQSHTAHPIDVRERALVRELRVSADPRIATLQRELRRVANEVMNFTPQSGHEETEVERGSWWRKIIRTSTTTSPAIAGAAQRVSNAAADLEALMLTPLTEAEVTAELERVRSQVQEGRYGAVAFANIHAVTVPA